MKELASLVSKHAEKNYTITQYVNDITLANEEVLAELDVKGNVTSTYTYGLDRLSHETQTQSGKKVTENTGYYLYNGLNSVTGIATDTGEVQATYTYDPYGNLTAGEPAQVNFYGYNGESTNTRTGLQYLRARYYDMSNGNFITEDTYAGQTSDPSTLNRYTYVSNNPINREDPSGHIAKSRLDQLKSGNWSMFPALPTDVTEQMTSQGAVSGAVSGLTQVVQNSILKSSAGASAAIRGTKTTTPKIASEEAKEVKEKNIIETLYDNAVTYNQKQQESFWKETEMKNELICGVVESENGRATINLIVGILDIVALALLVAPTGGGAILPLAFGVSYGLSDAIIRAQESYNKGENAYLAFSEGFVDGLLYGETLGLIGGAVPKLVTSPIKGATLEAGLETLVDSLFALKNGVVQSVDNLTADFVTNFGANAGGVFKPIADKLKNIKAPKVVDDILDWFKKLGKGGTSSTRNLVDDIDEIAEDIININKQYSDGFELNNSIKNILNSASYYDDPYEQVAAVTRSITDHAFANGNKRTAFDTLNMLLDDLGLDNTLTDSQKWDLIYDIAEGRIDDVAEIANILKGK